jgi:hypothetical protein
LLCLRGFELFRLRSLLFMRRFELFRLHSLLCMRRFELCVLRWQVVVFFGELSRVLLQGHELLRLGAWYWLGAPNGWNTTGRPQVVGRSVGEPVNPIFSGPPDDPTSIHKSRSNSGWVNISSPYLSLNRLL